MLEIKSEYADNSFSMICKGHADYSLRNDIVCASASALVCTMANLAEEFSEHGLLIEEPYMRLHPGDTVIKIEMRPEHSDTMLAMIHAVQLGLKMLASKYPDNITVDLFGEE